VQRHGTRHSGHSAPTRSQRLGGAVSPEAEPCRTLEQAPQAQSHKVKGGAHARSVAAGIACMGAARVIEFLDQDMATRAVPYVAYEPDENV